MKILMLAPLPPPSGGIASWTVRYRDYCRDYDRSLEIVNLAANGSRSASETKRKKWSDEARRTFRILRDLKKGIRRFRPDIIHLNTSCSPLGVLRDALCMRCCVRQAPTVLHCRCNIEDQLKGHLAKRAFGYLVKKAHTVIVLNGFSQRYVDGIRPGKAVYVPNFVNDSVIAEPHSVNETIKTVISVGHVQKEKGLFEIIETAKQNPDLSFVLVGAVRDNLADTTLPDNLQLTGRLGVDEVRLWLDRSDVFLFPTKSEGFSNALLEAMARGLPCIATDVGANRMMLEDKGGIVLTQGDVARITEALTEMKSSKIRQTMSDWNIEKVKRAYRDETVMAQYFELYQNAAGGKQNEPV